MLNFPMDRPTFHRIVNGALAAIEGCYGYALVDPRDATQDSAVRAYNEALDQVTEAVVTSLRMNGCQVEAQDDGDPE